MAGLVPILGTVLSGVLAAIGTSLRLCIGDIVKILLADTKELISCLLDAHNYLMIGSGSLFGLSALFGAIPSLVGGFLSGLVPITLNQVALNLVSQLTGLLS